MSIALYAQRLGGDVAGKGRVICPGPGHSRNDRSLSVTFGSGGFLVYSFAGDDWKDCRDHVADLLGIGESRFSPPSADDLRKAREAEEVQARKIEARAQACWREAVPIGETVAERYLRSRGITAKLPDTLRFHPGCFHPSTQRFPALVSLVEGGERFAIHRTYLREDGTGKAAIDPSKAMLGPVAGSAVRLTSSGYRLAVCEGIETGLSLASGLINGNPSIWAALSTSGLKRLELPPAPGKLIIATDGDDAGRAGGNVLAERAVSLGWEVSLLPAPDGHDWNDILQMKGKSHERG